MNTENQTLRLSLAAFAAIIIHTLIVILIYALDLSLIEIKEKTIPFKLVSASSSSANMANHSGMTPEDNARAAQEYLSTLNQSQFSNTTNTNNKTQPLSKSLSQRNNAPLQHSTPSRAISDLHDIFRQSKPITTPSKVKQISSKDIEKLSDYEVILLEALAKESLYDPFHKVMKANKRKEVSYIITLSLFPNGAIKNASIRKPSGLAAIDELAIQTAYSASPYPAPPRDDIQLGYKYNIPIIYKSKGK